MPRSAPPRATSVRSRRVRGAASPCGTPRSGTRPRRAASEVRASEEDRRALCLRLVELELRIQTPVGPKPPVGEEGRPEAGALHPLQELLGNDLVGVDVGAWQRGHGAGVANEG